MAPRAPALNLQPADTATDNDFDWAAPESKKKLMTPEGDTPGPDFAQAESSESTRSDNNSLQARIDPEHDSLDPTREFAEEGATKTTVLEEATLGNALDLNADTSSVSSAATDSSMDLPPYKQPDSRVSRKRAKIVATYVRTLEDRINMLEEQLVFLRDSVLPRKKESVPEPPSNPPCTPVRVLEINRMDFKQWTSRNTRKKVDDGETAVIEVALINNPGIRRSPTKVPDGDTMVGQAKQLESSNETKISITNGVVMKLLPESKTQYVSDVPVRLSFHSPWPFILLEQLMDSTVFERSAWIRPFKHFVIYERQIRKYVELLQNVQLPTDAKDPLVACLNHVLKETLQATAPNAVDTDFSDRILYILKDSSLHAHFKKNLHGSPSSKSGKATAKDANAAVNSTTGIALEQTCTCLQDATNHLGLLVKFIDDDLSSLIAIRNKITAATLQCIAFENLWHLYQPGDLIVSHQPSLQAYRVLHVSGGRPLMIHDLDRRRAYNKETLTMPARTKCSPFTIDCVMLDFDGEKFGPSQLSFEIHQYDGERSLRKLKVYPLRFAKERNQLEKQLLRRGQRFVKMVGVEHKRYSGLTLGEPQEEVDSEVIIDFALAFRQPEHTSWKPDLGLTRPSTADERELFETNCDERDCSDTNHNPIMDDTRLDKKLMDDFVNAEASNLLREANWDGDELSKDQLMLLPNRVFAFVLRNRKWVPLNIDLVKDIEDESAGTNQETAFEDLVIPEEYKKVVKALVENRSRVSAPVYADVKEHQVDLIRNKGKGLIILLHGVPGVGKTSTAESVAAYTRRPLLPITCGDIGQTAEVVERRLESLFLLARKWGCVLLLDEADVFLAKRERGDVKRNALVSVFLRVLEYYSGILFLTTNRVGSFDEAFKSRIHMSLYYPELSKDSTLKVWAMNLNRITRSGRNIDFKTEKIIEFAKQHYEDGNRWNGRQIRNAFQTAIALAEYEYHAECKECTETGTQAPRRPALKKKQFKSVAVASADFDDYLRGVMGGDSYARKAQIAEVRNDAWQDLGTETAYGKRYNGTLQKAIRPPSFPGTPEPSPKPKLHNGIRTDNDASSKTRKLDELRRKKIAQEEKEQEDRELADLERWQEENKRKESMAQRKDDDDDDE